ncbi:MAG: hypothetical protein BWX64_02586 [Acidobacteria bacterium ADurb.Bin051]|nr:MAG: hypothetical protein BWX64_02586 [Acidobacteria bacterium ADurb.Bin051]
MLPRVGFGSATGVESVTIPITARFRSRSGAKRSRVLPYDFDIFWPSVPGTTAVSARMTGSGIRRRSAP